MGRSDPPPIAYPSQPPHAPETIDDPPPPPPPPLVPPSNNHQQAHESYGNNPIYQTTQPRAQVTFAPTTHTQTQAASSSPRSSIPPPSHQPQAFPPPPLSEQDYHPPHPPPGKPQAFPPEPQHVHSSFPPPQSAAMFQGQGQGQYQNQNFVPGGGNQYNPNAQVNNNYNNPHQMNQVVQNQPWKSSLFDCMNDPENAIITACCPCVTFGQIAEIVDQGHTSCGSSGLIYSVIGFCIGIPCIMSCGYRTKLRSRFSLMESPAPDCIIHCFCEWCALCQEYRELKERGYDPAIGWLGNVARMQPQVAMMTPPMQHHMMGR